MNKEVFDKVSKCSSVDEVLELAKANGKNVTREQAKHAYNMTHNEGEISDSDISSVAGGVQGCDKVAYEKVYWKTAEEVQFIAPVGTTIEKFLNPSCNETATVVITSTTIKHCDEGYYDAYHVSSPEGKYINSLLDRTDFEK